MESRDKSSVQDVVEKIQTLPPDRLMPPIAPEHHSAFNIVPKKLSSAVKGSYVIDQQGATLSSSLQSNMNDSAEHDREQFVKLKADLTSSNLENKSLKSENESLRTKLDYMYTLLTPLQLKKVESLSVDHTLSVDTGHNDSNVSSLMISLTDDPVQLELQVNESLFRLKTIRNKETELRRNGSHIQPRQQTKEGDLNEDIDLEEVLFMLALEEREERKALARISDKLRNLKAKNSQSATLTKEQTPKAYWPRRSSPEKY
jgi:hypothetical protein